MRSLKRKKAMRKKRTKKISNSARRTKRNALLTALVRSTGSSSLLPAPTPPRCCRISPDRWTGSGFLHCYHRVRDGSA
uniref:Uncharacterized protein n=1 Tax=Zea mays TaxID=4577 RepID=C0P5T4_MAIZE|nr:unknown [Zea mays]